MARRRDGAMEKTTVKAKAKDDDELQQDGRAATRRSATRGDRRETADAVGQETAKLPFAEESARGTADGNADGSRCLPQERQGSAKVRTLRRWRRKMFAGTHHLL